MPVEDGSSSRKSRTTGRRSGHHSVDAASPIEQRSIRGAVLWFPLGSVCEAGVGGWSPESLFDDRSEVTRLQVCRCNANERTKWLT
jgi:hypothetical protein